MSERSPLKRTKSVAPRRCRIREGVDGTTAHGGSRARSKGKERRRRSCWLGASPATQAYDDVPTTHSFPEKMLNVPDREETAKHFLAPLLPGGRNHKRRQGPKEAAGMGLAYRQVESRKRPTPSGLSRAYRAYQIAKFSARQDEHPRQSGPKSGPPAEAQRFLHLGRPSTCQQHQQHEQGFGSDFAALRRWGGVYFSNNQFSKLYTYSRLTPLQSMPRLPATHAAG